MMVMNLPALHRGHSNDPPPHNRVCLRRALAERYSARNPTLLRLLRLPVPQVRDHQLVVPWAVLWAVLEYHLMGTRMVNLLLPWWLPQTHKAGFHNLPVLSSIRYPTQCLIKRNPSVDQLRSGYRQITSRDPGRRPKIHNSVTTSGQAL